MIKNLIPQDYETVPIGENGLVETVSLEPQARVGVAYSGGFYTVAADLDLTENDPVGLEEGSRFLSVGGELDAWGWAQLRAGYRHDIVDSDRSTASVGIGLSPFNSAFHIDLAVAASDSSVGAGLRIGSRF